MRGFVNKLFQNDATQEYKIKYPENRMLYSRYCKYAFNNDTKIYINNEKEIHGVCVWKIVCFCRFINKHYFIKYIAQYMCNILSVSKKNDIGLWQTYSTIYLQDLCNIEYFILQIYCLRQIIYIANILDNMFVMYISNILYKTWIYLLFQIKVKYMTNLSDNIFAIPICKYCLQYKIFYIANILSASNNIYCKYIGQYIWNIYCKYIVLYICNILFVSNKNNIWQTYPTICL